MCRVADQSCMTVTSTSDVVDCKVKVNNHVEAEGKSPKYNNSDSNISGNVDDRKRLLLDPLRIFYENVGGACEGL